tara:strand:- start:248 stop:451 length:204 start_codon:yes stop_codon:yes gene_type:complete
MKRQKQIIVERKIETPPIRTFFSSKIFLESDLSINAYLLPIFKTIGTKKIEVKTEIKENIDNKRFKL